MSADEPREAPRVVRFGIFEADLAVGELRRAGVTVKLQDQPFRLLALLLERPGELVTRDQLREALWPDGTLVDFEYGVNTAIKKLRQALGDSADNPLFIQTLPRKGYRFIAPVGSDAPPTEPPRPPRRRLWLMVAALLLPVSAGLWLLRQRTTPPPAAFPVPLVAYAGSEFGPAFSPDGSQLAFTWNGVQEDNYDIYVKRNGVDSPVRLTTDAAPDFSPAWSPDGRRVAFLRHAGGSRFHIMLVPASGGPEARVAEAAHSPFPYSRNLAFSPDGKWLAATDADPGTAGLVLHSVESGARRQLTRPPAGYSADNSPAFAPDGRSVAFVRGPTPQLGDLYILPLDANLAPAGEPRRLTTWTRPMLGPAWTADGSEILVSAGDMHDAELWSVPVASGAPPTVITAAGEGATLPALGRDGRLAFTRTQWTTSLWTLDLTAGDSARPRRWAASSSRTDSNPRFSPDGRRVAFISNRSGSYQIWIANRDGSAAFQVTALNAPFLGSPNWSPDGSTIVFDGTINGRFEVFAVSAAGGEPRRLASSRGENAAPTYSRDGRWIYFTSNRTGTYEIWRMSAQGGPATQWTHGGGRMARESADGRDLYFTRSAGPGQASLLRMPAAGGAEVPVLDSVFTFSYEVTREGVYYIKRGCREGQCPICFHSFATGRTTELEDITVRDTRGVGMTVAPDGRTLLLSHATESGADLMVLEHFR
jgi:Tol biopolymer transport system component/DNA-binding winged helix-turn-helix (wHTH) protein